MLLKILAVGDVVGEGGQDILARRLRELREDTGAHFAVVNGENASGVGITPAQARRMLEAGPTLSPWATTPGTVSRSANFWTRTPISSVRPTTPAGCRAGEWGYTSARASASLS